ncbi:MAG: lactonase family protein, partial [Acidobacteriaceae bacterium]|nr:lactonase family protein [Acidobacteriaceae bacterium]
MSWSQRIRKAAGQMLGRKFIVRRAAAMAVLLFLAFGFTACRRDFTVAYLYVTASSAQGAGFINGYQVDYQTGALVKTAGSPYAAGAKPVALVTTNDGLFVYVVNQDDNTVQEFAVHMGDGSLTSLNTYPTGNMPTSIAIDSANKFLYVTFTYWDGSSGTGGVDIFPINPDNSLGTPLAPVPVGNNPVGIAASRFFNLVYVVDSESPNTTSARGVILGFNQDPSTGALTPTPATSITGPGGQTVATGFKAGVRPSAIAIAPVSRFVYVTDRATNQLYSNIIGNSGDLTEIVTSPNPTGNLPLGITIDPRSL